MDRSSKARIGNPFPMPGDRLTIKKRKPVPHEFVLDAIASLSPWTRPMFGCLAVYVREKIMFILRDKQDHAGDNGLWLATAREYHDSLRHEFPTMRSIGVLGSRVTGWQVLPAEASDFEEAALRACELVVAGDTRIGKVPGTKRASRKKAPKKKPQRARRK